MNLDLGNTIWLNVSRKLLSYHKWFFTPFERMPRKVYAEFKRHKHTHPPKRISLKHHSHTHANATITSGSTDHTHTTNTLYTNCGNPDAAEHMHIILGWGSQDAHTHDVTLSFGSANLGSPNWYEHVHAISLVSMTSGGASHTHIASTASRPAGCFYLDCNLTANRHLHTVSVTIGSGGGSHTHTLPTVNTGNADSGQTPESHQHSVSFNTSYGNYHSHPASGTVTAKACKYGYSHTHTIETPTAEDTHRHSVSGNSGLGGETPPVVAPAKPLINMPLVNPILVNPPIIRALKAKKFQLPLELQLADKYLLQTESRHSSSQLSSN